MSRVRTDAEAGGSWVQALRFLPTLLWLAGAAFALGALIALR